MPEKPLLILPRSGAPLPRLKRPVFFGEHYRFPNRAEAARRFSEKIEAVTEALVADEPDAISPENVLVLETVGRVEDFRNAAAKIPGLVWQGEFDVDNIESDDNYFERPKIGSDFFKDKVIGLDRDDSKILKQSFKDAGLIDDHDYLDAAVTQQNIIDAIPEEYEGSAEDILASVVEAKYKNLSGRLYLSLSNRQALEQVKSLFDSWKNDEDPPELNLIWKNLFSHLHDIRFWSVEDRLRDTGITDYWEKEVVLKRGTGATIVFELELTFTANDNDRTSRETRVVELVQEEHGAILNSCQIPEIRFHALKIELPVAGVEKALRGDYGPLFKSGGILFFRPIPQSCIPQFVDGEPSDIQVDAPPVREPKVALLDGVPLSNHNLLSGYLVVDDPDNLSAGYNFNEFHHGTAMASLICHGEMDSDCASLNSKVYVRPVLSPDDNTSRIESIPKTVFFEDIIERSVRRMFDGEGDEPPSAPTVKIINLSIADPSRAFHYTPSSIARLLDWLSFKYDVLICVSAGNYVSDINLGLDEDTFKALPPHEKVHYTINAINREKRNRRIFAPSESINAISVSALHSDESPDTPLGNRIDLLPYENILSPVSTLGHGFRSGIKPDIFMPGGRQLYNYVGDETYRISDASQAPGQKVAAASVGVGDVNRTTYTRGTSNSTALASRSAVLIHDSLETLFAEAGEEFPESGVAPLLKALLIHGSTWGDSLSLYVSLLGLSGQSKKKEAARFLGYGVPNINKVLECTENRATAIGYGSINKDERHEYHFPLPLSLSGTNSWRKLTVTLAWNTPVNSDNRKYRRAALSFEPKVLSDKIGGNSVEANYRQVRNGTVQHEIIQGKKVKAYVVGDSLVIAVQCREDAGALDLAIPYALAVSLEVKEGVDIPVYDEVRAAIQVAVQARVAG